MARIGLVIRELYRRPGADALPGHLEDRYGITVTEATRLDAGVFRIGRRDGRPWVARLFLSGRPLARAEGDAEVLRIGLTAEEVDRIEGVLWVRPLWLACLRCWLGVVSSKVEGVFVPERKHIETIAAQVRAG